MVTVLTHRTWYTIRACALAHGLPFNTRQSKKEGHNTVSSYLLDKGGLKRAYNQLSDEEKEALYALQIKHGVIPLHLFTQQFGEVRPYKPWRYDTVRYPWKRPISITEKLWHLGLIEIKHTRNGQVDLVVLPDEVKMLLPKLSYPSPIHSELQSATLSTHFIHDLISFLSSIYSGEVEWIKRGQPFRWIIPRSLRKIDRRFEKAELLDNVRSERQTNRLRFLHYVLELLGLVQNGLVTPSAWTWLKQVPNWESIKSFIEIDLEHCHSLWSWFELPTISAKVWKCINELFDYSQPFMEYNLDDFYGMLRFDMKREDFVNLLDSVFTWLGRIERIDNKIILYPISYVEKPSSLKIYDDTIYIGMSSTPYLQPYVEMSCFTKYGDDGHVIMTSDSFSQGLEHGYTITRIIELLNQLTGQQIPQVALNLLEKWLKASQKLTITQVTLLTATDANDLSKISSDWRLRPFIEQSISPHHMVVKTHYVDKIKSKLSRRGYPITQKSKTQKHIQHNRTTSTYLYLATLVYRRLANWLNYDVPIPEGIIDTIKQTLNMDDIERSYQLASSMMNQLKQHIMNSEVARGGVEQTDKEVIFQAVEEAYRQQGSLKINYYSPYTGQETIRTIEPIRLYERNGARYVEAWCQLDDATRTFRLDRILKIIQDHHPMPAILPSSSNGLSSGYFSKNPTKKRISV